jgi:hypothetical protein
MVVSFHYKNIENIEQNISRKKEKKQKKEKSLQKVARSKKQSNRSKSQSKQERYWDSNLEATDNGYDLWNVVEWTDMCRYYSHYSEFEFEFESDSESDSECLNSYGVCSHQSIKYYDSDSDSDYEFNYNETYSYLLNTKSIDFESEPPYPVKRYVLCDIHQPIVKKCKKCKKCT